MKKNKKKVLYTKDEILIEINDLYNVKFSLISFQRNFRMFFKFNIINEEHFYLKSKITKNNISFTKIDKNYYQVRYSWNPHIYTFYFETQKELLKKLIKHNLI